MARPASTSLACSSRHVARETRAGTRRGRGAAPVRSLIVTRQPCSGNWRGSAAPSLDWYRYPEMERDLIRECTLGGLRAAQVEGRRVAGRGGMDYGAFPDTPEGRRADLIAIAHRSAAGPVS